MEQQTTPKKSSWFKGVLICVGIFVAIVLLGIIFGSFTSSDSDTYYTPSGEYIAILQVEGTIAAYSEDSVLEGNSTYNHAWTLDVIDDLIEDESNVGIVAFVNSPGGGVYESDELYLKLKEYQEETGRPYYSAMGSMAASGGYYISASADKIFANRNTWTGSIGVTMGTVIDISEFLEDNGIKTHTITAGGNKAMGGYFDPLTDEQKQIFQGLVDDAYNQFTSIVADGRNMDIETVKNLADGRVYTATQAMENGLVDEIGTLDDALEAMEKDFQLNSPEWTEIVYVPETTWLDDLLFKVGTLFPESTQGDIGAVLKAAEDYNNQPIQYLYVK